MAATTDGQKNFFQPLKDAKEIETLLRDITNGRALVQCRRSDAPPQDQSSTQGSALSYHQLTLSLNGAKGPQLAKKQEVVASFENGGSLYFFAAKVIRHEFESLDLQIEKVFKLQRRNWFRVMIPEDFGRYELQVLSIASGKFDGRLRVTDLSAGGISLVAPPAFDLVLKTGDIIKGLLIIEGHAILEVEMKLRNQRKGKSTSPMAGLWGCEFVDKSEAFVQRMSAVVNDLHRQLFTKFRQG
jgi:c-di-GMP-binding flagellar brake protein YcgR